MSRVPIDCPHCGKPTRVDLSYSLSTQKCDRCGIRFSSVNTGLAGSREIQLTEPPDWRRAKTGNWDEAPEDDATSPPPTTSAGSRAAWIAAAASLAAIAATVLTMALHPPPAPPVKPQTPSALDAAAPPSSRPGAYETLKERLDAATVVARQYLSARSVDDLLPLIENRESLESQIQAFYAEGEGRGQLPFPEFTLAPANRHIWVDPLQTAVISYEIPGQVPRAVALRQAADGRWLVDWLSAAAVNEVPLARFRADRSTSPRLFRLLAIRDDYYNRAFANDREWMCLRLSDPANTHRLYAYARRGTPVAEQLAKAPLGRSGPSAPIRLRLRFPEHAPSDDQTEITEFVGMGWLENGASPNDPPAPPPPGAQAPPAGR